MAEPDIKNEIKETTKTDVRSEIEIPNAFSKCANCSFSYQDSPNPVESVLLVCLHSFCRKCVNEGCLVSDKGDQNLVTCCKCKCNSNRVDCGVNLLAVCDSTRLENSENVKCSSCNDQTIATSRCTVCNDMLCDACVSAHRRVKLTRDHPIVNSVKVSKHYSCSKHSSEKLQCYCEVCVKVTCEKCHEHSSEHFNHSKIDVSQASATFRNNLTTQLQNLNEKEKTVGRALDIVNEKMADVDQAETKALSEVREYYNTCMEALRVRMNGLGSEIKKLATAKRSILEKMKEDVSLLQARLDESIKAVGFVAQSGDDIAILSVKKGLAHHMATLLKLKCQVPNPSHKLNIQLQTEPSLLSQVIPTLGRILVDGVAAQPSGVGPVVTPATATVIHKPHYSTSAAITSVQQSHGGAASGPPPYLNGGIGIGAPRANSPHLVPGAHHSPPLSLHQTPPALQNALSVAAAAAAQGGSRPNMRPMAGGGMPMRTMGPPHLYHQKQRMPYRHPGARPLSSVNRLPSALYHHRPPITSAIQGPNILPANSRVPPLSGSRVMMTADKFIRSSLNSNHNSSSAPTLTSSSPRMDYRPHHQVYAPLQMAGRATPPPQQRMPFLSSPSGAAAAVAAAVHTLPPSAPVARRHSNGSHIHLHLELDGDDPLNINGLDRSTSPLNNNDNRIDSLQISSVMSLAEEMPDGMISPTNGDTAMTVAAAAAPPSDNGHVTPPRERDQPATKRRKKTLLSPYHISSHHSPDDPNEDYCAVCHNGGELVCCDTCPKVYHANCHVPELTGASSTFSCSLCWDEKASSTTLEIVGQPGSANKQRKAPSGLSDHEVKICEKILLKMFCHKRSLAFHLPVPKTVKHYSTYIKFPMDFISIRRKLMRQHFNHYDSVKEFIKDMRLVFSNCVAFNGPISDYTESAQMVQQYFVDHVKKYFPEHEELAASILPPEEVMNIVNLEKKKSGGSTSSCPEDDPVVHIS